MSSSENLSTVYSLPTHLIFEGFVGEGRVQDRQGDVKCFNAPIGIDRPTGFKYVALVCVHVQEHVAQKA